MMADPSRTFMLSPVGEDLHFFYRGFYSQSIIQVCADALRMRMEAFGADHKLAVRKLIGAFIEIGQNIVHYSADALTAADADTDEVRFGSVTVEKSGDHFIFDCSNPVTLEASERLEKRLAVLTQMNVDEIKQNYREALRAEGDAASKGAGIGLLTLARDAVEPLTYHFADIEAVSDRKMFNIVVKI